MEIVLKHEPQSCIYCGSDDVHAEGFNPEAYSRQVVCNNCERYWWEAFSFDSVQVPDEFTAEVRE